MTPTQTLRKAVKTGGENRADISRETGIGESVLSRFVHGAGLRSDTSDRLCKHLGLELTKKGR